ncbi:MAG: phage tail protein [Gammaproteobacteria bacterium]|nr:phage tail protein [Gammaproteobacteria bacterium]MBQ0840524.1 phage tail protein [Gammaproteobacteria bacterium]
MRLISKSQIAVALAVVAAVLLSISYSGLFDSGAVLPSTELSSGGGGAGGRCQIAQGDGRTSFALPDLRGRTAVHPGKGPGLTNIRLGQKGGAQTHALTPAQMPSHKHTATTTATLNGISAAGSSATPGGNSLASKSRTNIYSATAPNVAMAAGSVTVTTALSKTGGDQSFSIRDPFLGIYHVIALQGVYPSRS